MGTMRTQREAGAAEKRRHATQEVARERERRYGVSGLFVWPGLLLYAFVPL
jgi:hypothetical protein